MSLPPLSSARLAANISLLFTEAPVLARPALAQAAGFQGVEVLFPYDHPVTAWREALGEVPLVLINTPPGDWAAGDRGFGAIPGAEAQFQESFLRAADVALALQVGRIHVMAGLAQGPEAEATFLRNLAWAAAQFPDLALSIEPLNPHDVPGYFLQDFDQAARILDQLALPQVGLQFDLWHAARIHGDVAAVWDRHHPRVRHVQIAGFPGRNEPDRDGPGFNLTALGQALERHPYEGWISAEYTPQGATSDGLGWLTEFPGTDRSAG